MKELILDDLALKYFRCRASYLLWEIAVKETRKRISVSFIYYINPKNEILSAVYLDSQEINDANAKVRNQFCNGEQIYERVDMVFRGQ